MGTLNCTNTNDSNGNNRPQECKAWVNFNGQGSVSIRDEFNIDSITDEGTGVYLVNFTNPMADTNYCVQGTVGRGGSWGGVLTAPRGDGGVDFVTDYIRIGTIKTLSPTWNDFEDIHVVVFGNQ